MHLSTSAGATNRLPPRLCTSRSPPTRWPRDAPAEPPRESWLSPRWRPASPSQKSPAANAQQSASAAIEMKGQPIPLRETVGHFQLTTAPTSSVRERSVGTGNRVVRVRLLPTAHRPVATPVQKTTAHSRAGAASALMPFRDDETDVMRMFCADDIATYCSPAWRGTSAPDRVSGNT